MRWHVIDFRSRKLSFLFTALLSSILLAGTLLVNDVLDEYIVESSIDDNYKKYFKFMSHVLIIFLLTLTVSIMFYVFFGYDTVTKGTF